MSFLPDELIKLRRENEELRQGLRESVWLQSHYAALLNMWDGGKRLTFDNEEEWLKRLERIAKAKGKLRRVQSPESE